MRASLLACALCACGHSTAIHPDASGDGGADALAGDAATCGGQTCRDDQSCVGGTCTFACTGAHVPGDYATIAGAVGALGDQPDAVICLAAQTYDESDLLIIGNGLSVIGVSADQTKIATQTGILGTVTIEGVGFSAIVTVAGGGSTLHATGAKLDGGLQVERQGGMGQMSGAAAVLDGCDVAGGIQLIDAADFYSIGDLALDVRNSYVHGGTRCVGASLFASSSDLAITAIGDTITGCGTGISVAIGAQGEATTTVALQLYNDIVTGHTTTGIAIDIGQARSASTVATGHDALWGNAANYSGSALDGAGYVKADCLLDTEVPPGLGAGSPCRAAGDPANTSPDDYWGHPRPSPPDIGAIQMP